MDLSAGQRLVGSLYLPNGSASGAHGNSVARGIEGYPSLVVLKIPMAITKVPNNTYPLKLQALGKLIFYRHIAHVTPKKLKSCVFKR